MQSANLTGKRVVRLLLGCVFAAVFLFFAFRNTNWSEAWETIKGANWAWLLLGLLCFGTNFLFRIIRWWLMLRTVTPTLKFGDCTRTFLIAMSLNNVIPFRAGDFYRAFGRHEQLGPPSVILTSIVAERLLDLASLLGIFFFCILAAPPATMPEALTRSARYGVIAGLVGIVFLLAGSSYFKRVAKTDDEKKSGPMKLVGSFLKKFFESFDLIRTPLKLLQLGSLSVGAWLLEGALFVCVVKSLSISYNLIGGEFALSTGTLGTIVPSTPGYVGVFDFFTKAGLMAYDMKANSAATCTLLIHVLLWLPITAIGGILMLIPVKKTLEQSPAQVEVTP